MGLPWQERTHEAFWRQLLRWLVSDVPGPVVVSLSNPMLFDDGRLQLKAEVRGKDYLPAPEARVEAHISGPQGIDSMVTLSPEANTAGGFHAEWTAAKPGLYQAEVVAK
jgi:hypothetical protein